MSATAHFILRVRERIGPHVDPVALAEGIVWAVTEGRQDIVEYIGRVSRDGKRVFRFRVPDERFFYALVDTTAGRCITVLPPGFHVRREGKGTVTLRETDL